MFKGADPLKLSATPSDPYGHRFMKFMKNFVFKKSQKLIEKERLEDREGILKGIDLIKLEIQKKLRSKFTRKKLTDENESSAQIKPETNII